MYKLPKAMVFSKNHKVICEFCKKKKNTRSCASYHGQIICKKCQPNKIYLIDEKLLYMPSKCMGDMIYD